MKVFDAVVVGGGPVGLCTALALRAQGKQVALLIQNEPSPFDPAADVDARVYALAPDVLAFLAELNVSPEVMTQRVATYRQMEVHDQDGSAATRFDAPSMGWTRLGCIVEHALLLDLLWREVQRQQISVQIARERPEWWVEKDHWRLPEFGLRTRLLLASDGAASPLREHVGITSDRLDYQQHALVCHVRFEQPCRDLAWQKFLPEGPLALLPLADGRASIVWSQAPAAAARRAALPEAAFCAELSQASERRFGAAVACSARQSAPLRRVLARRYVADRLVLLGDAAHTVHPMAGQGLNLGMRDAMCLARVLADPAWVRAGMDVAAEAMRERCLSQALRRYERERRSENAIAVHGIEWLGHVFAATGPLAVARGLALRGLAQVPPLRALLASLAAGRLDRPLGP